METVSTDRLVPSIVFSVSHLLPPREHVCIRFPQASGELGWEVSSALRCWCRCFLYLPVVVCVYEYECKVRDVIFDIHTSSIPAWSALWCLVHRIIYTLLSRV